VSEIKNSNTWSAYDRVSSASSDMGRSSTDRRCLWRLDAWRSSAPFDPYEGPGLRIGDGVRELEDASEGEGVIEPSSEPRIDNVS